MDSLDGKTALITGAASGIGLALAAEVRHRKMRVVADVPSQEDASAFSE